MTRSVPLRHLTVHLPAAGDGPPAARGQAAKGATRPNFAELLRTPQRPASRRPAASAARGDALPPDALPLPEAPQAMTDVAEAARIEPLSSVNDSAGDEDPGVDTGAPQDHPHVAAPALPEPVGACAVDELQPVVGVI